jgi:capsular polysaccharide biosynthesis protein
MDLSFTLHAIRRYWWAVVVGLTLGLAAGQLVPVLSAATYESQAILFISPPERANSAVTSDLDRYIAGQIGVLTSDAFAAQVAERLGAGVTANDVESTITVIQRPQTNVVTIGGSTSDPERAQRIVGAFTDLYFEQAHARANAANGGDVQALDDRLTSISTELAEVNSAITAVIAPFLPDGSPGGAQAFPPIPSPEQVAPELVTRQVTLLSEYSQVAQQKTQLETEGGLRVTSEVVQSASLPTDPAPRSSRSKSILLLAAGGFLGCVGAVVVARFSRRVLDAAEVAQVLKQPVFGSMPRSSELSADRREAFEYLHRDLRPFIDSLCVRAEMSVTPGAPLTVLVTGTQRAAGITTLAAALANRYAEGGLDVVLLDADPHHPELTEVFEAQDVGLASLLITGGADAVKTTRIRDLRVVGMPGQADVEALRQHSPSEIMQAIVPFGRVLIVDGGALFDSASTARLALAVDVVVLAVPLRSLLRKNLELVAHQLDDRYGQLFAVITRLDRP